ncbi:neuroguidin-like isoform X2 [Acanthaster planci]|uniref:Neuroguidin-like isoform X2 n=1 Tax=Acanthaster planci TaxID=133434 RepID=A0A8B7ZUL8_ACAPL|nr:neuroguidin-like isoform X2 [Acanthaster planci]
MPTVASLPSIVGPAQLQLRGPVCMCQSHCQVMKCNFQINYVKCEHMVTEQDISKLLSFLKGLSDQVSDVSSSIQSLLKKVDSGEISTSKGITFLEVKYHLLLSYLMNLTYVMLQKTEGRKLSGCPAVDRLVEMRTVLERMRPIDQKLQYQVDKLVKTALTGAIAENDPLRYRPNPANLRSKLEEEENQDESSEEEEEEAKPKKYVPPKVVAMHYDGDETVKQRQEKQLEKAKKRALSSALMQELKGEYFDGPEEVREGVNLHRLKEDKEARHKIEYEEDYFVRLPVTRKEKQAQRRLATTSSLKSLTRFDDITALDQTREDMPAKKKKLPSKLRKKLQKSAAKKRKRKF